MMIGTWIGVIVGIIGLAFAVYDAHLRNVGHLFTEANTDLNRIKVETFDAARDATACARQLGLVHSQIKGIQQSLFKDAVETLPGIRCVDVRAAEAMMDALPKADEKKPNTKTEPVSPKVS